jgi:hypothetical protein
VFFFFGEISHAGEGKKQKLWGIQQRALWEIFKKEIAIS